MNNYYKIIILICISLYTKGQSVDQHATKFDISYRQLHNEFVSPPVKSKKSCFWLWLNSNVTQESITKDLEAMKANGWGNVIIYDGKNPFPAVEGIVQETEAGPGFLSVPWLELFAHAIKEADRLGIDVSLNIVSGYNFGAPSVKPEHAFKKITFSETVVEGSGKIRIKLSQPSNQLLYKDLMVQAVRNKSQSVSGDLIGIKNFKIKSLENSFGAKGSYPLYKLREYFDEPITSIAKNDIIEITSFVDDDGILTWSVPEGSWTIIRFGMTNTGTSSYLTSTYKGLSLDHLNKEALLQFDSDHISKLVQTAKSVGNSLKYLFTDSWEMGTATYWTDDFMEQFQKRRGYDLSPYLPVLTHRVVENREISNRFLHDYRRTVSDLISEFHETFNEITHEHGLYTQLQSGGPHSAPIDALQVMRHNDVPMGEYWIRSNTHRSDDGSRLWVKQAASVAHIYGKRYVAAEGPTSIGPQWERSPKDVKNVIDRIFCSGVNQIVWHLYNASPDEYGSPGNVTWCGTQLNRHVTWWKESKALTSYVNRSSSMLSQGLFKADALYYYGDDVPNFVFLKEEVKDLGYGYDWDKCSFDILMDCVRIVNGRIVLPDGMNYSILVLPDEKDIKIELLQKLEELVRQGMVLVGSKPERASGLKDYPHSDANVKKIADRMWGAIDGEQITLNNFGKGKVIWGKTPGEVLKFLNIQPDFGFDSVFPDTHLDYIHRYTSTEDIYFVVNRLARHGINDTKYRYLADLPDRYEDVVCRFRVTGKVPELWNPMTGEIREVAVYYEKNGYTYIPLHFAPEGSAFIVFSDKKQEKHIQRIEKDGQTVFPDLKLPVSSFSNFEFYRDGDEIYSKVLQRGSYVLHWSDESVSSFTETDPFAERIITAPWKLNFIEPWGSQEDFILDSLVSWSDSKDEKMKYYSGSVDYSNTFNLNNDEISSQKIYLDLGNVQEIASLLVNGQETGISWIAPFLLDITEMVREGRNDVVIRVTNSWVNRLIGDSYLPNDKRFIKTNVLKFEGENKESYLRKSGLISQVKLVFRNEILLK